MEADTKEQDFNIGDYLEFCGLDEFQSWAETYQTSYNRGYSSGYQTGSLRNNQTGYIDPVYIEFDIVLAARSLNILGIFKRERGASMYRVQGKDFFTVDAFGDIALNKNVFKPSKGATVYVFTNKDWAVNYLFKKRLSALLSGSGRKYGLVKFKVDSKIIKEIYENAADQSMGVKWISKADSHIYGNKAAFGLHTNFISERLIPNITKGSGSYLFPIK